MRASLLHHGLERAADRYGDRPAILAGEDVLTFAQLQQESRRFASRLSGRGVGPGSRVAVMCSNRPEFVACVHGISRLGAVAVLLNPAWKELEVSHAVELTFPVMALADGPAVQLLQDRLGSGTVIDLDVDVNTGGDVATETPDRDGEAAQDSDVLYVFSSGTTGLPKAVRHTHRTMGHAIVHWRRALGLGPDDRFQVATPPSHILGLLNLVTAIDAGASVRLHRRFDLDEVLARIQSDRMTLEMAVAPIALALANHPRLESYDLSSLRYIMWGATPVTPSVAEVVTRRTGVRWLPAYGASELPVIAANPVERPASWRLDSAGLPPEGVQMRVVDLDSGEAMGPGRIGEIQVLSPSVMAGYLPAEATAEVLDGNWYRTGDVGWLEPDGWVHITDRSKEMIKVSGFQVAPAEIEGLLLGCAGVVDCAVFGISDERAGEVPVAAVQLEAGSRLTAEDLKQVVDRSLASYKRLKEVVLVESVPRLPSGKVLRRVLRQEWEPRLSSARTEA